MAVIVGVYDANAGRRTQFRSQISGGLAKIPGLTRHELSRGNLDIYCEASASTPVSHDDETLGPVSRSAFVVGDFMAPHRQSANTAQRLLKNIADGSLRPQSLAGQQGFYCAALLENGKELLLGVDALGMFPLYYWTANGVCLFGTSPELFKAHPLFVAKPSMYAVASILMVHHITNGQSLYDGVRLCRPGHTIVWSADTAQAREVQGNAIKATTAGFKLSFEETRSEVDATVDSFHAELAGLPRLSIMLSGGQDSRMVAGYLNRHVPKEKVTAVSLGTRQDDELTYALKVSRSLGWRHLHRDVDTETYCALARNQLELESLQGPFVNFGTSSIRPLLAESGSPFLSGYMGDAALGDRHILAAFDSRTGLFGFDTLFSNVRRYGFSSKDIADLLADHKGAQLAEEVEANLRADWDSIDGYPFQKSWLFQATQRQRFHIGSIIWRLSLGAWPLLPYVDRRLQEMVAAMPLEYFQGRRMQTQIIRQSFPKLARLPLDRNSGRPEYIESSPYRRFLDGLPKLSDLSWTIHRHLEQMKPREESRYYFRTYDFDSDGWQAVRTWADTHRSEISSLLNAKAVDRLLPRAGLRAMFSDPIIGSAGVKTLAGLVLWNAECLTPR